MRQNKAKENQRRRWRVVQGAQFKNKQNNAATLMA